MILQKFQGISALYIWMKNMPHQLLLKNELFIASFLSRVDGMYLPGKHALYFSQNIEFQNPCFIGDTLTVFSKVIDKSESTKILKIESKITNQDNKILLYGIGRVIVRDD